MPPLGWCCFLYTIYVGKGDVKCIGGDFLVRNDSAHEFAGGFALDMRLKVEGNLGEMG